MKCFMKYVQKQTTDQLMICNQYVSNSEMSQTENNCEKVTEFVCCGKKSQNK